MGNEDMDYIDAATFILIRPDGKILMQLRDDGRGKKIPYPNMWTFPGGEKEKRESHLDCVIREVKEEYNLVVTADQCEKILSYDHDNNLDDQIFVCRVPQNAEPELHEGRAMKWMALEEIKNIKLAWQLDKILLKIEEKLKSMRFSQ